MKNALLLAASLSLLSVVGCASPDESGDDVGVAAESELSVGAGRCVGALLELSYGADGDALEASAVATFDDRFVREEAFYSPRVVVPNALTVIHYGHFAPAGLALFGAPSVWSDGTRTMMSVHGSGTIGGTSSGDVAAKAIYDAMTKVPTTEQTTGGTSYFTRKSADGRFSCTRRVDGGVDRDYSCQVVAIGEESAFGIRLSTLETCEPSWP